MSSPTMSRPGGTPVLDVVVPVYNEERDLGPCVRRLHAYLSEHLPYPFRITIADNASVDDTPIVAKQLAEEFAHVVHMRLEAKGRGLALRTAWTGSDAPVLAYMDVDLSTDLAAVLPLVAPLISGHSDLAIGSRLARGSRVVRGPKREFISRGYNLLLRRTLAASFSDAQCGFKAIRADVAGRLLPLVRDTGWFFDTELLVLAQRAGLRIHEVPVDWVDDPDSRVDIVATAVADVKGIWRLGRGLATGALPMQGLRRELGRGGPVGLAGQLVRFLAIGVASTLAYLLLYALLRLGVGPQVANLLALLVTAVANTAANRRLTFGVRGSSGIGRHHLQGLVIFGIGLLLTSGSLSLLSASHPRWVEVLMLTVANLVATLVRFLLLRVVFQPRGRSQASNDLSYPLKNEEARWSAVPWAPGANQGTFGSSPTASRPSRNSSMSPSSMVSAPDLTESPM
jgi:putative flippase GtrA